MMQFSWFSNFYFYLGWGRGKGFSFPLLEDRTEYLMESSEFNIAAFIQENFFKRYFFSPIAYSLQHLQTIDTTIFCVADL